jgi:thymidylate kinase
MLINIVGGDGSGKTTQIEKLKTWLTDRFDCSVRIMTKAVTLDVAARSPDRRMFTRDYESLSREFIEHMTGIERPLFLYYLSAAGVCRHPPGKDEIVLLDGYWVKTYAAEAALGVDPDWLLNLGRGFPRPAVTILLDVLPEIAAGRLDTYKAYECGMRDPANAASFIENQTAVCAHLHKLASSERWKIIEANGTPDEVFASLKDCLQDSIKHAFRRRTSRSLERK